MTAMKLNRLEMRTARNLGQLRQGTRVLNGDQNAHGSSGGAADHILGVMGEMVFAKIADRYPSGLFLDKDDDNDVGGIQVRTRREYFMELYLWERDPDDAWFALICGEGPRFDFRGMIHASNAKLKEHWKDARRIGFPRTPCYVVPHEKLISLAEAGFER